MPHTPFRYVLNTLLYILITGCRWCDLPHGKQWASKSSAHRWLKRWQEDGTLALLQSRVLDTITEGSGMPLANRTTAANGSEREQVFPLLDSIKIQTRKPGRPRCRFSVLAADKGYDSHEKRSLFTKIGTFNR